MPVLYTSLMQETWDAATAVMNEPERRMAESWRMAFDAAHDGLEAMRDIWPRRRNQIAVSQHDDAQSALRAFESGYSRVATWRKTLPALTSLRPLLASIPEAPADPALNVIVIEARLVGCCV